MRAQLLAYRKFERARPIAGDFFGQLDRLAPARESARLIPNQIQDGLSHVGVNRLAVARREPSATLEHPECRFLDEILGVKLAARGPR
jgi:hypothetical protein